MIAIVNDPNLGDALCAAAVVQSMAEHMAVPVHTIYRNTDVEGLVAHPECGRPIVEIAGFNADAALRATVFDIHPEVQGPRAKTKHPSLHYADQARWRRDPGRPKLIDTSKLDCPSVDYLFFPFADDPTRKRVWPYENWLELATMLEGTICVLGAATDEQMPGVGTFLGIWAAERPAAIGWPLPAVVEMMKRTKKAVVTIDSGPNRLAWAADIRNHVLLCADEVPRAWGTYLPPDEPAAMYYGSMAALTPRIVADLIRGI